MTNDRGAIHIYRQDEESKKWEGYGDDSFSVELGHKCSVAGETLAVRNLEGVELYHFMMPKFSNSMSLDEDRVLFLLAIYLML